MNVFDDFSTYGFVQYTITLTFSSSAELFSSWKQKVYHRWQVDLLIQSKHHDNEIEFYDAREYSEKVAWPGNYTNISLCYSKDENVLKIKLNIIPNNKAEREPIKFLFDSVEFFEKHLLDTYFSLDGDGLFLEHNGKIKNEQLLVLLDEDVQLSIDPNFYDGPRKSVEEFILKPISRDHLQVKHYSQK